MHTHMPTLSAAASLNFLASLWIQSQWNWIWFVHSNSDGPLCVLCAHDNMILQLELLWPRGCEALTEGSMVPCWGQF